MISFKDKIYICQLYKEMTAVQIAEFTGLKLPQVNNYMSRNNIPKKRAKVKKVKPLRVKHIKDGDYSPEEVRPVIKRYEANYSNRKFI